MTGKKPIKYIISRVGEAMNSQRHEGLNLLYTLDGSVTAME